MAKETAAVAGRLGGSSEKSSQESVQDLDVGFDLGVVVPIELQDEALKDSDHETGRGRRKTPGWCQGVKQVP